MEHGLLVKRGHCGAADSSWMSGRGSVAGVDLDSMSEGHVVATTLTPEGARPIPFPAH